MRLLTKCVYLFTNIALHLDTLSVKYIMENIQDNSIVSVHLYDETMAL